MAALTKQLPNGYNLRMYDVVRTREFDEWLSKLRDAKGKARIIARIRSAELGNLGDVQPVGEGISEMRIHYWPGYRVYFKKKGNILIRPLSKVNFYVIKSISRF